MRERPHWWRKRRPREKSAHKTRQLILPTLQRPRRGKEWKIARAAAERDYCEACNCFLHVQLTSGEVVRVRPPIHHIIAEAFLRRFAPDANPHLPVNLLCVCKTCHGHVLSIEARLFRGDKLGFLAGLRELNWPMERIETAMKSYGL